jgi:hypothetical protein
MKLDKYNAYRDSIRTGDAVFWSGKGNTSSLIKRVTGSPYSHISMAIWLRLTALDEPRLFTIESTTLNTLPDATDNTIRRGVQLHPLAQRIEGYNGEVWWSPLLICLTEWEIKELIKWALQQESSKIPYENTKNLIKAAVDIEEWPWYTKWIGYPFQRFFNTKANLKKCFVVNFILQPYNI